MKTRVARLLTWLQPLSQSTRHCAPCGIYTSLTTCPSCGASL